MNAELSRDSAGHAPVFVDASGRRRRGVVLLGYLGASACTAYLAAFGITVSTNARTLEAAGVALTPSPVASDEDGDEAPDAGDIPADAAAPAAPSRLVALTPVARTSEATVRPAAHDAGDRAPLRPGPARGRHAAPAPHLGDPHGAVSRVLGPPRVGVRVVPRAADRPAGTATTPRPTPRPTTPTGNTGSTGTGSTPTGSTRNTGTGSTGTGGTVTADPLDTPDSPTTGGSSSSSGSTGSTSGSGNTSGSGSTSNTGGSSSTSGSDSTGSTQTSTETSPSTTTGSSTPTDPVTADILTTGTEA
jgi:hypothetical protein